MSGTRALIATYVALMLLLAATFGSHYLHLGHWNAVINLGIATAKMVLIALFFMDLRHEKLLVRTLSVVGIIWLSILFTLTLSDYLQRGPGNIS